MIKSSIAPTNGTGFVQEQLASLYEQIVYLAENMDTLIQATVSKDEAAISAAAALASETAAGLSETAAAASAAAALASETAAASSASDALTYRTDASNDASAAANASATAGFFAGNAETSAAAALASELAVTPSNFLPITGGTLTGSLTVKGSVDINVNGSGYCIQSFTRLDNTPGYRFITQNAANTMALDFTDATGTWQYQVWNAENGVFYFRNSYGGQSYLGNVTNLSIITDGSSPTGVSLWVQSTTSAHGGTIHLNTWGAL